MIFKNFITWSLLLLFVVLGFYFRIYGIKSNHSFWADESHLAAAARGITFENKDFEKNFGYIRYEIMQIYLNSLSFRLFGVSEFSARLPAVIFGTIGILFAFLVGFALSGSGAALMAAFLTAFSQINLANSTQNKPYIAIQTLFFVEIFLIAILDRNRKNLSKPAVITPSIKLRSNIFIHFIIIMLAVFSYFLHVLGALIIIPYFIYLVMVNNVALTKLIKKPWFILVTVIVVTIIFKYSILGNLTGSLLKSYIHKRSLFAYNNFTFLRELLWKNYGFIFLPSIFGMLISLKRNKTLTYGSFLYSIIILYLWCFRSYSHNVRYLVPFFGLIFIYTSVFWSEVGKTIFNGHGFITCLFVCLIIYAGGNEIVRKAQVYYSPNEDLYGDVQIADYKSVYALLMKKFPDIKNIVLFDDINGTEQWYLNRNPDVLFSKGKNSDPGYDKYMSKYLYRNLNQFIKEKEKYKNGILIVEDWESLLPEDIKQYAKKNMKLEFRVEGIPQAGNDKWPIEVYSWGM